MSTKTGTGSAPETPSEPESPSTPSGRKRDKIARMKARGKRAQTNLTGLMIGVLIATIVAVQVFIPVVNDAVASSNLSGTTETVVSLLPLFAGLLLLISLASPLMRRF